MKLKHVMSMAMSAALLAAVSGLAIGAGKAVVVAKADLQWKEMGIPGLAAAAVSGDMEKGANRFFLKYPVGFVTPKHHHSADHYVTVVSGTITLTVDGQDHQLGPGSYFALTEKMSHTAKVEGNEEAVFFIQADGPWDVVMEQ
jgi:mannose-6-phosphate isomerase-like protein (cupin superfamily)